MDHIVDALDHGRPAIDGLCLTTASIASMVLHLGEHGNDLRFAYQSSLCRTVSMRGRGSVLARPDDGPTCCGEPRSWSPVCPGEAAWPGRRYRVRSAPSGPFLQLVVDEIRVDKKARTAG